jgi:hypothetical protein
MGLLDLPNELILWIAEVSSNSQISALARSNSRLYNLLIDYLYRQGLNLGHTVYNWCCETGMVNSLQRFITCGLDVRYYPLRGHPLWVAGSRGHTSILRVLCENGISLDRDNCFIYDPLIETISQGHQAATQLFLDFGMDVNYCNRFNISPLIEAVSTNNWDMCKLLISRGAHLGLPTKNRKSEIPQAIHWTALHEAVRIEGMDILELLVSTGADVNVQAEDGTTPLHWTAGGLFYAAPGGKGELFLPRADKARLLLEHGADLNIINNDNKTPMDQAFGEEEIIQLFLEYGAVSLPREPV